MNKKQAKQAGFDNGYSIGMCNMADYANGDFDRYMEECSETESDHFRQFSPFEFFAKELNDLSEWDSMECWDAYDAGVQKGLEQAWNDAWIGVK